MRSTTELWAKALLHIDKRKCSGKPGPPTPSWAISPQTWTDTAPQTPKGRAGRDYASAPAGRASPAILENPRRADNSGHSARPHLRKRINAQRLALSTCKAGALPAELRPHILLPSDV